MFKFLKKIFLAPFWFCMGDTSWIGAIVSSKQQGKSAKKAVEAQIFETMVSAQLQREAMAAQQANFDLIQKQYAPYRAVGERGVSDLSRMLSGGYNMQESPSAKYAMQQGTRAINANLQARGLEGNAVQQLGQLSGQTAASDYSNRFNQLLAATNIGSSAVAGTGSSATALGQSIQSGANTQTSQLQQAAQNIGNIYTNLGSNLASNIGGAAGSMGSSASSLIGNMMNRNWGGGGGGGGGFGAGGNYDVNFGTGQGLGASISTL